MSEVWKFSDVAQRLRRINRAAIEQKIGGNASDYELDINIFGQLPRGDMYRGEANPKWEFLLSCFLHQYPDLFVVEREGVRNEWLVRMAKAVCWYRAVILLGAASVGKTFFGASYAYTLWKSQPDDTAAYVSTTSAEAGEARTWGAVKDFYNHDRFKIGVMLSSHRLITLDAETVNEQGEKERDMRHGVKAVLIKSGQEGQNVVGAICGRKSGSVTWCCDEMAFMDMGILDARVNLFSNDEAQFIGIGNAPREGDPLYIDAEPHGDKYPDGWRSVEKDRDYWWPTRTGVCLYFNGEQSPNVKAGRKIFPRMMDCDKRDEIRIMAGGEDTPIFWSQFYGFPASVDVPDKIITHRFLEKYNAFKEPEWAGLPAKVFGGFDPGFRKDGDPCCVDFGKLGTDVRGKKILAHEADAIALPPSPSSKEPFEKQIAIQMIAQCRQRDCHDLALDVSGDGGLMLQAIEKEARAQGYTLNVVAVSFMGTADDKIVVPGEKRKAKEMYDRKVTQLWAQYRLCVQNDVIRGVRERCKAVNQLCSRKFSTDEHKRFVIEKKELMKKRIRRSPDHADARVLLGMLALMNGLSGAALPTPKQSAVPVSTEVSNPYASGHATSNPYGR